MTNFDSNGLIILQIGIMFGLLFVNLSLYNQINTAYFEEIIQNQETIIDLLNNTNQESYDIISEIVTTQSKSNLCNMRGGDNVC